jgi:hypothetical protein
MATYNILKGLTVVGKVDLIKNSGNEHKSTLRIGQLVGNRACRRANINYNIIVDQCYVDWDRLDNDHVLDQQPWGLEPQ